MAQQRQYETATLFNMRAVDMRHLWNPSLEYKGKKQDKASYFGSFITPKTQAQWHTEPQLAGLVQALGKLHQNNTQLNEWPIADGDMPNPETGKQSEWARGHWIVSASTYDTPPNVELVQAGGQLVKLTNKVGVKSGDFCMIGVSAAVSQNNARKVKLYLNAVVFSSPGEEIVFANSVSGAELMRMAQQQGLQVAGFGGAPQFGGAQQQPFGGGQAGFFPPNGAPQQPGFVPQTAPGGFAPTSANPATASPFNQPQGAPPFGQGGNPSAGTTISPFSQPQGQQFGAPVNPFGQR